MNYLEKIHVRLESENRREIIDLLRQDLVNLIKKPELESACIHCHGKNKTDLCLHLLWNTAVPPHGSDIALNISHGLQAVGLVHHTVWQRILILDFKKKNPLADSAVSNC